MTKKERIRKMWHWNLDVSGLPEEWHFSPPSLDRDDPEDVGYAMLSLAIREDTLVLMGGGRGSDRKDKNRWFLYGDDSPVVGWPDCEVIEKTSADLKEVCKWALEYYLARLDAEVPRRREVVVAQMHSATPENCVEVAKSIEGVCTELEDFIEQRCAAVTALSHLSERPKGKVE